MLVHENPDIFPEPFAFKPERWLAPEKDLDKYLVAFGKGPRICLGLKYEPLHSIFLGPRFLRTSSLLLFLRHWFSAPSNPCSMLRSCIAWLILLLV